jgi:hypothetical protein
MNESEDNNIEDSLQYVDDSENLADDNNEINSVDDS